MAIKPKNRGKPSAKKPRSKSAGSAVKKTSSKTKISRPPPKQVKTKPGNHNPQAFASTKAKKKCPAYTDAELGLPALNMITPATAASPGKGSGKKKNKIFVDDTESMMTILAVVNAQQEGQIESKVMKMRQMEEVREAKRVEAEKREEERKLKLEGIKRGLKKKSSKINKSRGEQRVEESATMTPSGTTSRRKKTVSFA